MPLIRAWAWGERRMAPPEHAGGRHISPVLGLAGDLVDTIGPHGAGADDLEFAGLILVFGHQAAPFMSAAVAMTARMILS